MDPFGQLGVGLGGNCDFRCGILYSPMLGGRGWFLQGLVSLTSSPYSSGLLVPGGRVICLQVLLCVRRLGAFGFVELVF